MDDKNNKHTYKLNFTEESSGTRVLFAFAPFLKRAFETTKIIVVDELERSMHPALVEFIVKLFISNYIKFKYQFTISFPYNITISVATEINGPYGIIELYSCFFILL